MKQKNLYKTWIFKVLRVFRNYAFPQKFRTRKIGKFSVVYAVLQIFYRISALKTFPKIGSKTPTAGRLIK